MSASDYDAQKDVARANRDFYRSFERLDLAAMRAVWLDDERIQCIHPGAEALIGPARVHAAWETIFRSTTWIRFELADVAVQVFGELAWVTVLERIHSKADDQSPETLVAEALATNLFARKDGAWKLLLHHASPLARRILREP
ncbi:MAG: nuclear transport factor 2 family protein [Planctomycetes bacterium]|nr:nuclear transport factor 2 family protein [Planctomycetota bacterium]MCC6408546.1 nuclear transport factor 2 family protein [Planctomycetota bacterium]